MRHLLLVIGALLRDTVYTVPNNPLVVCLSTQPLATSTLV